MLGKLIKESKLSRLLSRFVDKLLISFLWEGMRGSHICSNMKTVTTGVSLPWCFCCAMCN